jgi:hypothetical protein
MGENLLREGLSNICFYSTNMNAPYIHVVQDPVAKLTALNYLYPNKNHCGNMTISTICSKDTLNG